MPDGVRIDTDGVEGISRDLRSDAAGGFTDAAGRGARLHDRGVGFGARLTPSGVVAEAKGRYATALANTEANLRAYQVAAGVLADAAEEIARLFAASDLSAADAQREVQEMIAGAVRAATAAAGDPAPGMVS